jgi:hypothetical protein
MGRQLIKTVLLVTLAAAPSLQSARAQCAPGSQIFIDPRLVPHRSAMSPQQLHEALRNPYVPWEAKRDALQRYQLQSQPIQIPFNGGIVLISPTDPCVQQYVRP